MAWTTPKTWASGYVVLAADLNTHLRDNLNVTAPAVMTTAGDIIYASGANTPARLAKSTTSTQYLANTGTSNVPAWNEVALDTGISGTLPVGNGGTGQTSLTTGAILIGNSSSAVTMVTQTTKGQILIGDGTGPPQMLGVGDDDQVLTADSGETTGVKWAAAGGGGSLILVGTAVASTSATLDITGLDSTYDTYLIVLQDIIASTDGNEFYLRVGDSGGVDSGATDYAYHLTMKRTGAADIVNKSTGASSMKLVSSLGNAAGEGLGAAIWLHRPGDGTMDPLLTGSINAIDDGGNIRGGIFFGRRNSVITLDRIQCLSGGAAITSGRMTIFGLAHA